MALSKINPQVLQTFETGFNPRHPKKSATPAEVLGYGEISTVLEIATPALQGLACKRMPMFRNREEVEAYFEVYQRYLKILEEDIGLNLLPSETAWISDGQTERVIGYIFQEKVNPTSVGNYALRHLPDESIHISYGRSCGNWERCSSTTRNTGGSSRSGLTGKSPIGPSQISILRKP